MPKLLTLKSHLSSEELKPRYRNSCDPVERSHTKSCLNTTLKTEVKAEGRGQRAEGFKSN